MVNKMVNHGKYDLYSPLLFWDWVGDFLEFLSCLVLGFFFPFFVVICLLVFFLFPFFFLLFLSQESR